MAGVIVLGYDGSDAAKAALEAVAEIARSTGDEVVVAFGFAAIAMGGENRDLELAVQELGVTEGQEALDRLAALGVTAEVAIIHRRPADALLEVAQERGARFIAVGSHGEGPIVGAILGSVPYKLVDAAEVPVLVVPAKG